MNKTTPKVTFKDLSTPHASPAVQCVLHLAIRDSIRDQEKLLRKAAAIKK